MVIEVLFVPGCPNHAPTVSRIREILHSESIQASIKEIAVTDESMALALSFPGSPTIRINGEDIEPSETHSIALSCRLYASKSGIPSGEALRSAILRAKAA